MAQPGFLFDFALLPSGPVSGAGFHNNVCGHVHLACSFARACRVQAWLALYPQRFRALLPASWDVFQEPHVEQVCGGLRVLFHISPHPSGPLQAPAFIMCVGNWACALILSIPLAYPHRTGSPGHRLLCCWCRSGEYVNRSHVPT